MSELIFATVNVVLIFVGVNALSKVNLNLITIVYPGPLIVNGELFFKKASKEKQVLKHVEELSHIYLQSKSQSFWWQEWAQD